LQLAEWRNESLKLLLHDLKSYFMDTTTQELVAAEV
jgi:hypothetical protein